jgi:hypothetical protein
VSVVDVSEVRNGCCELSGKSIRASETGERGVSRLFFLPDMVEFLCLSYEVRMRQRRQHGLRQGLLRVVCSWELLFGDGLMTEL